MKTFREVLRDWMEEVDYMATSFCEDGTPRMGKHETEEVYRYAKKFLAEPDTQESVLLEKTERVGSVLQDWTQQISTRQQGVLIIALRGPDGVRKEDSAKPLVRTLRGLVMNAGRTGGPVGDEVWSDDPFMTMQWINTDHLWESVTKNFFDQWDAYNVHFLQHLMHAFAIAGIHYPERRVALKAWEFYARCCRKLHLPTESPDNMVHRLRDGIREEDGRPD